MFAWGHSIVIPWFVGPSIWRVRFRQMGNVEKGQRYRQLAGCGNALYLADTLKPGRLAVMTEGEIDTLSIRKLAPSDVATVATGGVSNARRGMWIAKLVLCEQVLLAFDDDVAGYNATSWWTNVLPNAKRWLLPWGDANDYVRSGGDIAAWLAPAITSPQGHHPTSSPAEIFDFDDGHLEATIIADSLKTEEAMNLYLKYEDALIAKDAVAAASVLASLRALKAAAEVAFDFDEGLDEVIIIVEALKTQNAEHLYLRYEDALIAQDIVAAVSALEELRALKATTDEWQKFEQTRQFDELLAQREGWR